MIFQLEEIKAAHSKVKSGADFPKYIDDLKKLGVLRYDSFVGDGHTVYFGANNYQIQSPAKYENLKVENAGKVPEFRNYLKIHQQGQTDYPTFCRHSAETGVEKWTVDLNRMICTYYDKSGNKMHEEKIPGLT